MATRTRDKWISLGIVLATVAILVYLDWIVLVYVLYVIGGFMLLLVSFDRRRIRSRWARSLLVASALLLVLKGGVQLLMQFRLWTPSPAIGRGLPHTLDIIGGVVLGFLLAVAFSGQLAGRKTYEGTPSA